MLSPKVCLSGLSYVCILEHPAPDLRESRHPTSLLSFDRPNPCPPTPIPRPQPTPPTPRPLTAEFYGRGRRPPGLRAEETTHTRTQDTHAGVLAVHRVFLFSICTWLPPVGCGAYLRSRCRCSRRSERREPEEGSSIYIRNISLF